MNLADEVIIGRASVQSVPQPGEHLYNRETDRRYVVDSITHGLWPEAGDHVIHVRLRPYPAQPPALARGQQRGLEFDPLISAAHQKCKDP